MIILPLQWEKHTGPDSVGQHKLIFTMDESINHGEFNPLSLKKGTQFLVMLVEADTPEQEEFAQETPEETKDRLWKQMHALLTDISVKRVETPDKTKEWMKGLLKKEGYIKESTKELDLNRLASVIIRLKKYKNEISK